MGIDASLTNGSDAFVAGDYEREVEDEERKRKKREEEKIKKNINKSTFHGSLTHALKNPFESGSKNPILRIGNMHFIYF